MPRSKRDIWELVDHDPVCTQMSMMHRLISTGYPHFLGLTAGKLLEMLRAETYDRIDEGEADGVRELQGEQDGSQPVPGRRKRREESL